MKKVGVFFINYWRKILLYGIGLLILAGLLFYRLNIPAGFSQAEVDSINTASSLQAILANPLFFLYKLGAYVVVQWGDSSLTLARSVSSLIGFVTVILFFLLMKRWFGVRSAYIASALFATSSWFLHYARIATPLIMLPFGIVLLLTCAWWVYKTQRVKWALVISAICGGIILYIPGMVWFMVALFIFQGKRIRGTVKNASVGLSILAVILGILLLAPLVRAMVMDFSVFEQWIGLPAQFSVISFIKELLFIPVSLLLRSETNPAFNLGTLPLLDVFTGIMVILGAYSYGVRYKLGRTKLLIALVVIASVLVALMGGTTIILLAPIVYYVAAAGVAFLLQQWLTVFPSNPLARGIGITLIIGVVGITCLYHVNRYFVAWSEAPVTKQTFSQEIDR